MSNTPRTDEVKLRLNGLPDKDQAAYMFFHACELELENIHLLVFATKVGVERSKLERECARLKEDAVAQAEELRLALADVKRLLDRISDLKDEIDGFIPEHGRRGM